MQTTELDPAPALSQPQEASSHPRLKLVIGNKNYSSWSMRPWVAMTAFGVPFEEIMVQLDRPDTGTRIAEYSHAGRVPVLIDGDLTVWDSLAICEYLAERCPEKGFWPRNPAARALARSVCAEMHSSFTGLRSAMWMNIRARFPGKGRTAQAQADIGRISEIWESCLARSGPNGYLFGDFSIADAFYAPVVMRFRTYEVALAPALQAYVERIIAHPAVAQWMRDAENEPEHLKKYDVYPD
ncbi:glutathione S-transferase family protein [Noviherbaspirillum massiliense]|uniref:glutathione S-transferase family protein n=1 Tax=Noviherbaspirillum massiliense TaxID=1465823 RepID=UPI0003111404|nr:glutathione S-transferase family protein [Noviherbaspirillum massiliense]